MSAAAPVLPAGEGKIPSLDGIRAVSFLLVFAAHAGLQRIVPGGFGVTVFFFLSGYLITRLLRAEIDARGTIDLGAFYMRRALRILPPFYFVLALATLAAVFGLVAGGFTFPALCAQALHAANYWIALRGYEGQPSGTGVYWSLAVEEHFYLLFPCVYLLVCRVTKSRKRQAATLWALAALVLAWRCILVYGFHCSDDRAYVATDTRVDSILFGCAFATIDSGDGPRLSERTLKWVAVPIALAVLLFTFTCRSPEFRQTFRYSLQGLALQPIFAAAVRYPTWGPFRILNLRPVAFAGVLSYSLYLVHHVVLDAFFAHDAFGPAAVRALLALLASFALAWGIYELLEKPCARLRKRALAR